MEVKAPNESISKKPRLALYMALGCGALFAISTLVLAPIYTYLFNDAVISTTLLPELVKLILDLADIAAFALAYSAVIFAATFCKIKRALTLCAIYIVACVARSGAKLALTYFISGDISAPDILSVALSLSLETAQVFLVLLISRSAAKKHHMRSAQLQKAALRTGDRINTDIDLFSSAFSSWNPMQSSALMAGIMLSVIKLLSRVVYDIAYGAPEDFGEAMIMAAYYFSDILVCFVFYTFCWLILSFFGGQRRSSDPADAL